MINMCDLQAQMLRKPTSIGQFVLRRLGRLLRFLIFLAVQQPPQVFNNFIRRPLDVVVKDCIPLFAHSGLVDKHNTPFRVAVDHLGHIFDHTFNSDYLERRAHDQHKVRLAFDVAGNKVSNDVAWCRV